MATDPGEAAEQAPRRSADSAEKAYEAIRAMLVDFTLRPDERLNELRLSKQLGLSRTPVREALNRLASEGFVTLSPNRGFAVRSLSTEGMIDLYELRSVLECAAFRMLCERASDAEIATLSAFWEDLEARRGDAATDDILEHDEVFHLRIAELCGNPELIAQLHAINPRIRFIRRVQIEQAGRQNSLLADHGDLVRAAKARDIEAGIAILKKHIELTVSATQEALKHALLRVYVRDEAEARSQKRRRVLQQR